MAVLNQDTRLIMTILFVGAVSGANVFAYATMWLLDRKITAFWERRARDEQQRRKMTESAKQYNTSFPYAASQTEVDDNTVSNDFLAVLQ